MDLPRFRGEVSVWDQVSGFGGNVSSFSCFLGPSFGSAESIFSFSNRDGKGKRKVIDLASLSSFQVFLWFDRAAGFPSPRPQDANADARRSCQGWPRFAATEGLAFT